MSDSPEAPLAPRAPIAPLAVQEQDQDKPTGRGRAAVIGASTLAALSKGKAGLLLLKGLPFGKLLLTSGTMFASMFLYAARGGWAFGVGLVVMLLIHELGHGYAMKRASIAAGWPIFIPFLGAVIAMKERPAHPCIEADIAYAGPVAGTGAALVCAGFGLWAHSPMMMSLAYTGFFLNLFNLVPFGFLDGGRVARVISRKAWIVGALLLGALYMKSPSPQLLLIAVMGGMHALRSARDVDLDLVTDAERRVWGMRYFGLCAFLGACIFFTHALVKAA